MNPEAYKHIHSVYIDEEGEMSESSDHNVVLTYLNLKKDKIKWEKNKWEIRTFYSTDEDRLELFVEDLKRKLDNPITLKNLHTKIEISQEKTLKIQKKMRLGRKKNKSIVTPEWVDEELKSEIKKRRKLNRKWRKAEKKKEPK